VGFGSDPGELTLTQLAAKHCVHQTLINAWKKQTAEGSVFPDHLMRTQVESIVTISPS